MALNVVLVEPEIPQNAGNIARRNPLPLLGGDSIQPGTLLLRIEVMVRVAERVWGHVVILS